MPREFSTQSLGTRHVSYAVRDKDDDTVGQALLWTLRKGLGEAFTPDVEAAWSDVYAHARIRNVKWVENAGWSRSCSRRDDMIFVRQSD